MLARQLIIKLFALGVILCCVGVFTKNILLPHIRSEQIKTKRKALLITIDYNHPTFDALFQFSQIKNNLKPSQWSEYLAYYNTITKALPNMAESYLFAGYCYFYGNNDQTKAIQFLEFSAQLSPSFFWTYYDLAVLFLNKNLYKEASIVLSFAVNLPPEEALNVMLTSKIYSDFFALISSKKQILLNLKQGYETASILLPLSIRLNANPNDINAQENLKRILNPLTIQIF